MLLGRARWRNRNPNGVDALLHQALLGVWGDSSPELRGRPAHLSSPWGHRAEETQRVSERCSFITLDLRSADTLPQTVETTTLSWCRSA